MNFAVIFAGGVGKRMHSKDIPKQFLQIHEKPIIVHTIELFNDHSDIDGVVISCVSGWIDYMKELVKKYNLKKVLKIVPGGACSQESIYNGLVAAEEVVKEKQIDLKQNIVLVHDGVRPLITANTITDNIRSVKEHGSAITCVRVKETVLLVDSEEVIREVPNRESSRLARAPQSFYLDEILETHRKARREGKYDFIDCCSMMQYYGKKLYLVEGPLENIKITTPDDFYSMRAILDARENAQIYGLEEC